MRDSLVSARLHVVLVEPEIPNNTGNIGRTCIAAGAALHLVHPLGFQTDDRALKRAGMDYWPRVDCTEHASWGDYERARMGDANGRHWLFTTRTDRCFWDAEFVRGDTLVFGKESVGLERALLDRHPERCVTIPMMPGERSINLASSAAIAVFEAVRQMCARGVLKLVDDARLVDR